MKFLRSYQRFSLLAAALLCLFTTAQGQDFWSEGIHFNLMDNNAAEVTYMDYDYYWGNFNVYDQYRGDIVIPSSVNAWVYPQYEEPYEVTVTVKAIGSFAFNNCNELTSVTLPNTIESIGFYAFLNCPALASITCMGTTPPVAYEDESCFDATTYETATLYVPAEALEAYKTADVWRNFANIVAIGGGEPDAHMSGYWLLMLDRNNNELWYELIQGYDGSYTTTLSLFCYIFGYTYNTPPYYTDNSPIDGDIPSRDYYVDGNIYEGLTVYDARFCFVVDGVRYGPSENYVGCEEGYAMSNPLYQNNNYFTMMTGRHATLGILMYDDSDCYYAYLAYGHSTLFPDNFPEPFINVIPGDVDGDGELTIGDVTGLIDIILNEASVVDYPSADVDDDGVLNIGDLVMLIDKIMQL